MASSLKQFFNREIVEGLARDFTHAHPGFDARRFTADALKGLDQLELMARGWHIAEALRRHLPEDFPTAADVIVRSLRAETAQRVWTGMGTFRYLPHIFYVSKYGIDHLEPSMRAQYELTQRFTAEFSIRPFIERYPAETYARLREWAADPSHHVRRLVSEGTRPRLPWAPRLRAYQKDPAPVIALLDLLKDDPELYVRRSVANSLNDIAKDHPELAIEVARRWSEAAPAHRQWIIQHALRSLVKSAHPGALSVLGIGAKPKVTVTPAVFTPASLRLGEKLKFSFQCTSTSSKPQTLQIDFRVHFVKSNGKSAPKVFKLRRITLEPRQTLELASRVSFAPMTTRKCYPGVHEFEALINGVSYPLGSVRLQ